MRSVRACYSMVCLPLSFASICVPLKVVDANEVWMATGKLPVRMAPPSARAAAWVFD